MTDQNPAPQGQPEPHNSYQGQPPAYSQQQQQQQPYGQQPYQGQQPYSGQPATAGQNSGQRNTLALVSLILGILGFFTFITAIGAIVTGHLSLSQIKKTGEQGRGMALAGTILGYVAVLLGIISAIALFAFFAAIANNPGLYDGSYTY